MKGFTLIEVIVVVIIVGVFASIVIPFIVNVGKLPESNMSWGVNGWTEIRCIEGYKFIVGHDGRSTQIMDSAGKGKPCLEKQ